MDLASHQPYRSRFPQVVHLRMASGTQLLQALSGHRVALDFNGHRFQLPSTSVDTFRLQSP